MRWGYQAGVPSVRFVEAANPVDLTKLLVELLLEIGTLGPPTQTISAMELAGAGDGHIFTIRVEYGDAPSFIPISDTVPLVPVTPPLPFPVIYMADNSLQLASARAAVLAALPVPPPNTAIIGSEIAGATQAHRVCGLELLGTIVPPIPPPP